MATPVFTESEALARDAFTAMMRALSYPGRPQELPAHAAACPDNLLALASAVLDLETSFFTPDATLAERLAHTTARLESPDRAEYHFYTQLDDAALQAVEQASIGTMLFPDRSATLFVPAQLEAGAPLTLQGPGIKDTAEVRVGGVPEAFWKLRTEARRYPLGWDVFCVDGPRILGLPRSTEISAANA